MGNCRQLIAWLTLTALLMAAGSVQAQWIRIVGSERGTIYLGANLLAQRGHVRQFWVLMDWDKPVGGVRSVQILEEADCLKRIYRKLQTETFSGAMGDGQRVQIDSQVTDWVTPGADSWAASVVDAACALAPLPRSDRLAGAVLRSGMFLEYLQPLPG